MLSVVAYSVASAFKAVSVPVRACSLFIAFLACVHCEGLWLLNIRHLKNNYAEDIPGAVELKES